MKLIRNPLALIIGLLVFGAVPPPVAIPQTLAPRLHPASWSSLKAPPANCDSTGVKDCAPGIALLIQRQGRRGTLYVPKGTYKIATDLTIPAGMTLRVDNGGQLSVAAGTTLTIETLSLEAGDYQIFTGEGRMGFSGGQRLKTGWFPDFAAALDIIAQTPVELAVTRSETLATDQTVPANITLVFTGRGRRLTMADGTTLAIQGPVEAGLWQIFDCPGQAKVVLGPGTVPRVYPQWWGAVADGVVATGAGTDNLAAINAACAAYPVVHLPRGVYKITAGIQLVGDQVFSGDGMGQTVIFASRAARNDSYNMMTSKNYLDGTPYRQRIHLKGLSLECRCNNLTEVGNSDNYAGNAIALWHAEGSLVEEVFFKDTALNGICLYDTAEATVRRCVGKDLGHVSYPNNTDPNWEVKASANGITFTCSQVTAGSQALVEDCFIDTFRDVGINFWSLHDGRVVNCTVKGGRLPGVKSLNGGVVGFSSEGLAQRVTFDHCKFINCLGHGFLLGPEATAENCTVVKDPGAANGFTAFSIQNHGAAVLNCRVEVPGANHFLYGVGIWTDLPRGRISGAVVQGCKIAGAELGIWAQNVENAIIAGNYLLGGFAAQTAGIRLSSKLTTLKYLSNSQIRNNTLVKSKDYGIELGNMTGVFVENNLILGATTAAIHVVAADGVVIRGNLCRQYDQTHKLGYAVLFDHNPGGCQIIDNDFQDYHNTKSDSPYGMYLPTSGTPALVVHSNTGVPEEKIDGKLTALAGSYIRTRVAAGNDIQTVVNTTSATGWTVKKD